MTPSTTILIIFSLAFATAVAATPAARSLASRIGFFDKPNARKMHVTPVPMLGGVAIFLAIIVSVLSFGHHHIKELASILIAALLMALVGLQDDRGKLSHRSKLILQISIASGLYFTGVQINLGWLPDWLNFLMTVCWITLLTNSINFLDNMDGLSPGVSGVAAAYITVIAAMNGQYMVASLSAAVLGACIGFLFFNTRPASVYMGDAGSLCLGLLLSVLAIKLRFDNTDFVTWMVPLFVMAVPLFDTAMVLVSRTRRGVNPFTTAGKDHISHRLVNHGLSPFESVLSMYVAGCMSGLMAIFIMQSSVAEGYQAGGAALVLILIVGGRLESKTFLNPPS